MAKKLVPSEFKTHLINQIIESVTERANTAYYAFVGDHKTVASTLEEINPPTESVKKLNSDIFRNMLFGKKMTANDIRFVINRYDWISGTVYEMYDDEKSDLQDSNFYVVVDEDAFKHVYKCLYNNNGAPSTSKPLFQNAKYDADLYTVGDDYYETADGYQWKYMYSVSSNVFNKFATEKYIPVVANTAVQDNAVEGSIDVIKVVDEGKQYDNYITSAKFEVADINRVTAAIIALPNVGHFTPGKANQIYRIKLGAERTTDYYKNTVIYLTSGVGSGQYRTIEKSKYISDLGGVYAQLDEQFTILPNETTTYEIMPKVNIIGDGNQSSNAAARAIVNSSTANSINKIEMLNVGQNYSFASATVLQGNPRQEDGIAIVPTPATIRPIIPPQGGHGANTIVEFGARRLSFYMKYNRGEAGLVEPTNTFSQFGIIRDPQFANVAIYTTDVSGNFVDGEKVYQMSKLQIGSTGTFIANSTLGAAIKDIVDVPSDRAYNKHFSIGDSILLKTESPSPKYLLTQVAAGSSANTINISETPYFITEGANTNVTAYYVHMESDAIVSNREAPIPGNTSITSGILVNNCRPYFRKNRFVYGETSRNVATIAGIDINNRIGQADADFQFADYNQMLKVIGSSIIDGPFTQDETVRQGTTTGQLHSTLASANSSTLSLTNIQGNFTTIDNLIGDTSEAQLIASPTNALDIRYGDLDPNRGAILYIQNDIPVDRDDNQSEEIRVILEF